MHFDVKFNVKDMALKADLNVEGLDLDATGLDIVHLLSAAAKVEQTSDGAVITITDKSGTTTATITNGKDGRDGVDGKDGYTPIKGVDYFEGKDGKDGKDGYTPVKGVDYFDGKDGKDGRDGVDGYTPIKGVDYFDGKDGREGVDGKDGYTPTKGIDYFDGRDGRDGVDGKDGIDGYTPVKGVDYFDGKDGQNGADGKDGVSPTVAVTDISGGHRVTITDKDGAKSFDVMDGKDGQGGGGGTIVQADMAQNDPTQADYVKNRTHWSEGVKDIPIQGMWWTEEGMFAFSVPLGLEPGQTYVVTWDGVEYECVAKEFAEDGMTFVALGNSDLLSGTGDTGEPFLIGEFPAEFAAEAGVYGMASATDYTPNHEFSIKGETVHKLDNKFIDAEWMAKSMEETVLLPTTTLTPSGGVTGLADPSTGVITNYYNLKHTGGTTFNAESVPAASDMYILADGRKYYGTFYSKTTSEDITGTVYMFDTHLGVLVAHWLSFQAMTLCAILAKEEGSYTVAVGVGGRAVPLPEKYIPDNLKALIGTTDEITPAQVAEAVEAGRPIALARTDATFGDVVFSAFVYAKTLGVVQASGVFYANYQYVAAVLVGGVAGGGWNVLIEALAPASSVPTVQDIIDALPIYNGEVIAE